MVRDIHLKYADDGQCKDVGPAMIILKDEEGTDNDRTFPTAFSPTLAMKTYSLDIDLDVPENSNQNGTTSSGMAELYAQVVPKSQRIKNSGSTLSSEKKDLETSLDAPVSNGEVAVDVDPNSQYASVVPKSERNKPTTAYGTHASNGVVLRRSANLNMNTDRRSQLLPVMGDEPVLVKGDSNEVRYRTNTFTGQGIKSALGDKVTYRESAEL